MDELLADVNKQLSFKIRGEFSNKYRQQAILELLGQDFARLHFPHHKVPAGPVYEITERVLSLV